MTPKEGLDKIKAILGFSEQKNTFKNAKLNDGNIISYDGELATGTIVMVVDESGASLPLPIGDYKLEDGTTFSVVDETGAIDNVVAAAMPENNPSEVTPVEASTESTKQSTGLPTQPKRIIKSEVEEHVFKVELDNEILELDFSSIVNVFNDKIETLSNENIELKKQIETNLKFSKQVADVVSQIADEPASVPTESKQSFNALSHRQSFKQDLKNITNKLNEKY